MFMFMPDFGAAVRTLTSFGSGALLSFALANQSLAASATVSLAPAAGRLRCMTIGVKAGAAGTAVIQLADGTNAYPILTITAATLAALGASESSQANAIQIKNNDAANAAAWATSGADFIT